MFFLFVILFYFSPIIVETIDFRLNDISDNDIKEMKVMVNQLVNEMVNNEKLNLLVKNAKIIEEKVDKMNSSKFLIQNFIKNVNKKEVLSKTDNTFDLKDIEKLKKLETLDMSLSVILKEMQELDSELFMERMDTLFRWGFYAHLLSKCVDLMEWLQPGQYYLRFTCLPIVYPVLKEMVDLVNAEQHL